MRISIAMATYNGSRYLREQLRSIADQIRQPDELVVSDDASHDDTADLVKSYSKTVGFSVHTILNCSNVGYAQNFSRAIAECDGGLVFLSDQDDVWDPRKLKRMHKVAVQNPDALLLMSDAEITLGDGTPTGLTKLNQTLSLGLPATSFITGCCMALRRELIEIGLPVPDTYFDHDAWFSAVAESVGGKMIVPDVLQKYRRHENNASEWLTSKTRAVGRMDLIRAYLERDRHASSEERLARIEILEERLRERRDLVDHLLGPGRARDALRNVGREKQVIIHRLEMISRPRLRRVAPAIHRYLRGDYRYFTGWKSLVRDVFFP